MSQDNEAETALRAQLRFIKEMGGNRSQRGAAVARNILHGDLWHYDKRQSIYELDDATRDRLIAHARQDAAHAVISITSVQQELKAVRRGVVVLAMINIVLTALVAFAVFR